MGGNQPWVRWEWIADNRGQIWDQTVEHLQLTLIAVGIGFVLALGLSLLGIRFRRLYPAITSVAGILYTIPSLALFAFFVPITGLSKTTAEIGLVSYTLLILIRNITAGLDAVPPSVREAARGLGYRQPRLFWEVELPLAVPSIIAGLRIATVTVIGLVTVTSIISLGGLGLFILDGLRRDFLTPLVVGTVLTIALAATLDAALLVAERRLGAIEPHREGVPVIDFLGDVLAWLTDPANWEGERGIGNRLVEHVLISVETVAIAAAIALPAGIAIGHSHRWPGLTTGVVNIARAIPSFAVVALALPFAIRLGLGIGYWPTFLALVLLALPPIFTNAVTAIRVVEPRVVEAARGLGMRERELLWQVEIPLAVPLILAGVRVAAVQVVATATLGALVGWGGLGRFIVDGFAVQDNVRVFGGALLVALLAVLTELGFAALSRWRSPRGVAQTAVAR